MFEYVAKGKVWKFGDYIDTDTIINARYLKNPNPKEWIKHVMESIRPGFGENVKKGDIIVAGKCFGYGSAREHAVIVFKEMGISAMLAESFARVFFRNAVNNGIPVIECKDITVNVEEGDILEVNLSKGIIRNLTKGTLLRTAPLPDFILKLIMRGGLMKRRE
ncbi:MAG: 3-isopropylmalate dehydratase [Candidatus Bathyarchaeia archaeon]